MLVDPTDLQPRDVYQLMVRMITPRPIAWVSTYSEKNGHNLAPFSFFNGVTSSPPSVVFSPVNRADGSKKDTVLNIEENGEFVVNIVSMKHAETMNQSSADYPRDVDEFDAAKIKTIEATKVRPHRVLGSPIQLECKLIQIVPVGEGPLAANLVIGRIELIHLDDLVLDEKQKIDPAKVDAIGRMGGASYCRTTERFDLPRPVI